MSTVLAYLEDTYKFSDKAHFEYIANDERGYYCVLDSTIFYPQGGGQPSDVGTIEAERVQIPITFVSFVDGEVRHYGNFSSVSLEKGEEVTLNVDEARRIQNAKAHTAGHLMYTIVESFDKNLIAIKGYHFPDGSYVEFQGSPSFENMETFIAEVNTKISEALNKTTSVEASLITSEQLAARWSNIPSNLPPEKSLRVVTIGNLHPTPCGGTHLKSLNELKSVVVTKAKRQKGNLKISYKFE
ncbi:MULTISPECIES: alanine--tRNA ligase-related protein [unclassified Nostoc]|uniref:alanine--tRNA ligase-related protein n=1 Tax=unclassified Nostoc TaxID=2593658 RepID=UPI002AD56E6C|nr:alanine--tRNA ligase-related protein [Nostoc sp. DedQUE03]MDZ7972178.1 alanine--tRNA ligase-related protein [Nostoc sp. DedQUE03]MDZ8047169.1 alanine--tRNA ligase-related protein [Nostoc sp. DedQUE02]